MYMHVQVAVDGKLRPVVVTSNRDVWDIDDIMQHGHRLPDGTKEYNNLYWSAPSLREFINSKNGPTTESVYNTLREHSSRFFCVDDAGLVLCLSFVMGTYVYPLYDSFGLLHLSGQVNSGKTWASHYIANTSYNGRLYDSITVAALVRDLDEVPGTIVLDENEPIGSRAKRSDSGLADIMRSSFTAGTRKKICADTKQSWQGKTFHLSRPIAFGNVGGVTEDALGSRVIPVQMRHNPDFIARPRATSEDCQEIREMLFAWSLFNWQLVRDKYKEMRQRLQSMNHQGKKIGGRYADAYSPLMAIMACISEEHVQVIMEQMIAKQATDADQIVVRNPDIPMLLVLKEMITHQGSSRVNNTDFAVAVSRALNMHVTAHKTGWLIRMYQLYRQRTHPGNWATYDIDTAKLDSILLGLGASAV